MPAVAQMAQTNVVVSPGTEGAIAIRVRNVGDVTETYAFVPTGISQGWATVAPATVTLFPGADEVVQVTLRPPRTYAIPAGATPLVVRIVPHGNPDDVATVEGTVTVLEYDDRRISLAQPVLRAKRRHEFDVVLDNMGNGRTTCRLMILDDTNRVAGRFDPPSLGVDPGMNETTRLRVKARRRRWRRGRPLPFTVAAVQDGHETTQTFGTLLQEPIISGRFIGRLAATGLVAGALTAAWFHLIRPEIQDAADRAVARSGVVVVDPTATTLAPPAPPVTQASTSQGDLPAGTAAPVVTAPPAVAAPATGEPFSERLVVTAPLAQESTTPFVVPDGRTLDISDIFIQNTNNNLGRLKLLRNAEVLYEWSLDNVHNLPVQLISVLRFTAGQSVILQITCQGTGDSPSECSVAATLLGTFS